MNDSVLILLNIWLVEEFEPLVSGFGLVNAQCCFDLLLFDRRKLIVVSVVLSGT